MTVLANALLSVPAGTNVRTALAVPGGMKQAGIAQKLLLTFDADAFPPGETFIKIELSPNSGKSGQSSWVGGTPFPPGKAHVFEIGYALDSDTEITGAQLTTNAPSAFQVQTLIEVL